MPFTPTEQQTSFRAHARVRFDEDGDVMVGDWARSFDGVGIRDWDSWSDETGFYDWWNELFPEHAGVTTADLVMLDFQGHRAILKGVMKGVPQAMGAFVRLKQHRDQATLINGDGIGSKEALAALIALDPKNDPERGTGWYIGPEAQSK